MFLLIELENTVDLVYIEIFRYHENSFNDDADRLEVPVNKHRVKSKQNNLARQQVTKMGKSAEKRAKLRCVITKRELFTTYSNENPRTWCQHKALPFFFLVFAARALGEQLI